MGIKRSNSARILRKNSFSCRGTALDIEGLERFMRHTVPKYSISVDLSASASAAADQLAETIRLYGNQSCGEELENSLMVLNSFFGLSKAAVPSSVVFEVHSLAGQIKEAQMNYESAVCSYLKALWIASSSTEMPLEHLGLTLHRLGKVYGQTGDYLQGKRVIGHALATYDRMNLGKDHPCILDAKHARQEYETKSLISDSSWTSIKSDRRLTLIKEESERRVSV